MNRIIDAPESLYKLVAPYGTVRELQKVVPISGALAKKLLNGEPARLKYSTYIHITKCIRFTLRYSFSERIRHIMKSPKSRNPYITRVRALARFIASNEWLVHDSDNTSIFSESPTHAPIVAAVSALRDCLQLFVTIHRKLGAEFDDVLFADTGFIEFFDERISRYEGGKKDSKKEER